MTIMHSTNCRKVDLNLQVVLDAVLATKNLTRAAERLHLSQPAVSHAMAKASSTLLRGTVLTEAGPVELEVPRDRESSFEPKIVAKRQRRLTGRTW